MFNQFDLLHQTGLNLSVSDYSTSLDLDKESVYKSLMP